MFVKPSVRRHPSLVGPGYSGAPIIGLFVRGTGVPADLSQPRLAEVDRPAVDGDQPIITEKPAEPGSPADQPKVEPIREPALV